MGAHCTYEMQLYPSSLINVHLVVSDITVAVSNAVIVADSKVQVKVGPV